MKSTDSYIVGKPLAVVRRSDGRRILCRDLKIKIPFDRESLEINVKHGFDTDYSSIPTLLHCIVRWSRVDIAGVVHDWLYRTGQIPRNDADRIWRMVAITGEHCANRFQAWICWVGIRLFSIRSWKKYRVVKPTGGDRSARREDLVQRHHAQ